MARGRRAKLDWCAKCGEVPPARDLRLCWPCYSKLRDWKAEQGVRPVGQVCQGCDERWAGLVPHDIYYDDGFAEERTLKWLCLGCIQMLSGRGLSPAALLEGSRQYQSFFNRSYPQKVEYLVRAERMGRLCQAVDRWLREGMKVGPIGEKGPLGQCPGGF